MRRPSSLRRRILLSVLGGVGLLVASLGYLLLRANEENTRYVLYERLALAHAVQRSVDAKVRAGLQAVRELARGDLRLVLRHPPPSGFPLEGLRVMTGEATDGQEESPPLGPGQVFAVPRGPGEVEILVAAPAPGNRWVVGRLTRKRLVELLAPPLDRHGYFVQVAGPGGWLAVRQEANASAHAALCRVLFAAGHGGTVFHPAGPPDGDHYVTCVPLQTLPGWGIALERSPDGVVLLQRQLRRLVLVVGTVLLVAAVTVAARDVRRVLLPLQRLGAEAGRMRGGDLETPIRIPPADAELVAVATAMDQMRAALRASLEEVRKRETHLQAVHEVAAEVLRAREARQVPNLIVQRARELLGGDVSVLCVWEAGGVRPLAWAGPLQPDEQPLAGCPPGECPVLPAEYRLTRWAAPVRQASKVVGWLCVAYGEARTPRPEERRLLESLATCAGVALENVRLREELRWLATVEERERLARELHDGLAQALGIIRAFAHAGHKGMPPDRALQRIEQVSARAYEEVRQAIYGLRLSSGMDFVAALQEYVREFSRHTGVLAEVRVDGEPAASLSPEVEVQLVRIVQEALTNVWRHAQARRAVVRISSGGGGLEVAVEDDGVGFDPAQVQRGRHFGLLGMRERAASMGAQLTIESQPSEGTRVRVRLPSWQSRRVVGWTGSA